MTGDRRGARLRAGRASAVDEARDAVGRGRRPRTRAAAPSAAEAGTPPARRAAGGRRPRSVGAPDHVPERCPRRQCIDVVRDPGDRRALLADPHRQELNSMAVNLSKPDPASLHPVAGVTLGTAMAGVRKANRRDVTVVAARRRRRGRRRLHRQPVLRRAGADVPRAPGGRLGGAARSSSTPATPTPAPATTAWRGRARPARRWPRRLGCAAASRCCRSPPA